MSAPKPGDRVKVSYEGTYSGPNMLGGFPWVDVEKASNRGPARFDFPENATVEVLASPVYVNHDTTEYRIGDVIRSNGGQVYLRTVSAKTPWTDSNGDAMEEDYPTRPLTLLVRNGQVIA